MKLEIVTETGNSFYVASWDKKTKKELDRKYTNNEIEFNFDFSFKRVSSIEEASDFNGLNDPYTKKSIDFLTELLTPDFKILRCIGDSQIVEFIQNPHSLRLGKLEYIQNKLFKNEKVDGI